MCEAASAFFNSLNLTVHKATSTPAVFSTGTPSGVCGGFTCVRHSPAAYLFTSQQLYFLFCAAIALFYPTTHTKQPQHPSVIYAYLKHKHAWAHSPTHIKERQTT